MHPKSFVVTRPVRPHLGPLNCRWAFVISRGDGAFGAGDPGRTISASARDADLAGLRHDFERGGVADLCPVHGIFEVEAGLDVVARGDPDSEGASAGLA